MSIDIRNNNREDIELLVRKLETNRFERRSLALLMIKLRGFYSSTNEAGGYLNDIASFAAHDHRDMGTTSKLAKRFITHYKKFAVDERPQDEGRFLTHPIRDLPTQDELIRELESACTSALERPVTLKDVEYRCMRCVLENLAGARMVVLNSQQTQASIECVISEVLDRGEGIRCITIEARSFGSVSPDGTVQIGAGHRTAVSFLFAVAPGLKYPNHFLELSSSAA